MALSKEHIFGFDFINDLGYDNILKAVLNLKYKKGAALPFFITPNVDQIVKFEQEEYSSLKAFLSQSAFILPDGQPIVWSSKLLGKSLSSRLTGADFFKESFLAFEPYYKESLFVVSSEILASKLKERGIHTYVPPFFNINDDALINKMTEEIVQMLNENPCRFVFMGVGCPKQEILSKNIFNALEAMGAVNMPLFLLLGASYEFYYKLRKRAPKFFQKLGIEWLYRFMQEPRRMFQRYFVDDIKFISILFREWGK